VRAPYALKVHAVPALRAVVQRQQRVAAASSGGLFYTAHQHRRWRERLLRKEAPARTLRVRQPGCRLFEERDADKSAVRGRRLATQPFKKEGQKNATNRVIIQGRQEII